MRIDPTQTTVASITNDKPVEAKPPRPTHARGTGDIVKLSAAGATASASGATAASPARLDKIKAMIDAGTYPIDLDKLASRIVDEDHK